MLDLSILDKAVTLLPSVPEPQKLRQLIDNAYTKEALITLYKDVIVPFYERTGRRHVVMKGNVAKAEFTRAVAGFLEDEELFQDLFDTLEPKVQRAFLRLVWQGPCSLGRLEHDVGAALILPHAYEKPARTYYYYGAEKRPILPDAFAFFRVEQGYYATHPQRRAIGLLPELRVLLQQRLPKPDAYTLSPSPPPDDTLTYRTEPTILADLLRYDLFVRDGHIEMSKLDQPLKKSLRQMQRVTEVPEFFVDDKGPLSHLATSFLVGLILDHAPTHPPANGLAYLEALLNSFFQRTFTSLDDLLLSHLKGRSNAGTDFHARQTQLALLDLLRRLPPGAWIRVDDLHDHAIVHGLHLRPFADQDLARVKIDRLVTKFVDPSLYDDYAFYSYQASVSPDYHDHAVTRPLVQGFCALLAVLGLVDLAYTAPHNDVVRNASNDFLSPFDGVRGVRLTALGAYLLGKTDRYEAPEVEQPEEVTVTLDAHYLVFALSGEDKIKHMIADGLAERLGPRRYRLDYASFLRGCTTRADVDEQIRRFRTHLADELPPHFEAFFREVRHKIDPLRLERKLLVFKLDGGADLVRLIAHDDVLRRYVRKAEDHHIIVEQQQVTRVRKRLEAFGYLMPKL